MEDTLEPIELTAAELNAVAGGVAVAANIAAVAQLQAIGNKSLGGALASVNVELAIVTQNAIAVNV